MMIIRISREYCKIRSSGEIMEQKMVIENKIRKDKNYGIRKDEGDENKTRKDMYLRIRKHEDNETSIKIDKKWGIKVGDNEDKEDQMG